MITCRGEGSWAKEVTTCLALWQEHHGHHPELSFEVLDWKTDAGARESPQSATENKGQDGGFPKLGGYLLGDPKVFGDLCWGPCV